jgi:hypothetical protein
VDVHAVVGGVPIKALLDVVEAGALVSLGTTSDGGALGVTITVDGRWRREYFRAEDELTTWLAEALPAVESARGADRPSAARGSRTRASRAR